MKKRMVSVTLCLVMLLSAALGIGCSSTGTVDTTEAPRESQEAIGGQPVSEPALDVKSTPDVSKMRIIDVDYVGEFFPDNYFPYGTAAGIYISHDSEQETIEKPTFGNDVLFAVNLEMGLGKSQLENDESLLRELQPLKEYVIRVHKALQDEGYIIPEWYITDMVSDIVADGSDDTEFPKVIGKSMYAVHFRGLLTAEQILLMPEKFHSLSFYLHFDDVDENNEFVEHEIDSETPPVYVVVASSKDVTGAEIKAACSKSSPADYDRIPKHSREHYVPYLGEIPMVEYDLEGKRVLTASDLAGDPETGLGKDKEMWTYPAGFADKRTKEYVLADENKDAWFAVQCYVYYGVNRDEDAVKLYAMAAAKVYAEAGCPLNWAVVKAEGREGYYPFLYGYLSLEQLNNLSKQGYAPYGCGHTMLALADVDSNGNFIIDLMQGAVIVNKAE